MSDIVFTGAAHFVETEFKCGKEKKQAMIDFRDTVFDKPANFRKAKFEYQYPSSSGCVFHSDSSFSSDEGFWPDPRAAKPETAKEFCAKVRIILSKQGFAEEEHTIFRREMEFSRLAALGDKKAIWPFFKAWPYWLFKVFSCYGESIARPTLGLLGLWLVPALVFFCYFAWGSAMANPEWFDASGKASWSTRDAWGLSFANIFTFFGFQRLYFNLELVRALPATLQLMGALQTVLAVPLLFFFGLALRKRFRLR